MKRISKNLIDLIGNTPLMEVCNIERKENLPARLLVKIEALNPGGSVKDRAALNMIEDAERRGLLRPGATIIEPTSGNTGIGLSWIGAVKGYRVILVMPDTMSIERRSLLKAYGGELILTPGADGMKGSIKKAEELRETIPGSVILGQFENPANPAIHLLTTGEEIWRDTEGEVDMIIAGVGTGGTISGVAEALKRHKPSVTAIAVEPENSAVISGKLAGKHKIQGIGAGFVPENYHRDVINRVVTVSDEEAFSGARLLAREEGLLAGISSGAAFWTALMEAKKEENRGKTIVAILPDTGDRYLTTGLFDD